MKYTIPKDRIPLNGFNQLSKNCIAKHIIYLLFHQKRSKNYLSSSIFSKHLLKMKAILANGCKSASMFYLKEKSLASWFSKRTCYIKY